MSPAEWTSSLRELARQLCQRGIFYWFRLSITIILVTSLVGWIDRRGYLEGYRAGFYQVLQRTSPFKLIDKNTLVVFVDDDEYWKGELDRRAPIKRDYLARLLDKLDNADAKVIALDFDLRSPVPDGVPREAPDYLAETKKLLDTVKSISVRRAVVLPETVSESAGELVLDSDIYDGYDFGNGTVLEGYILPPNESLRVPVTLDVQGHRLASFSMAIAQAYRHNGLATLPAGDEFPYGSFLPVDQFDRMSAHDVVTGDAQWLREKVSGRVVIIGGAWSRLAYGRGPTIDSHRTPIGQMPGVYVHANYVEDILNDKAYPPLGEMAVKTIEGLLVVVMAVAFAAGRQRASKIRFVGGSWILLAGISYFSFVNLGIIFDLFVPAASVTAHWIFERIFERVGDMLKKK